MGRPSERSFELFFLASYDVDGFREFVASVGFDDVFDLEPGFKQELVQDEVKLLRFGFHLLRQMLFGEVTVPLKPDAERKRIARYRERKATTDVAGQFADAQDQLYESLDE